ncbi:MAG TPA: PspA/IM30 family protein, partial [Dehalococcoidia bacterium]|nr:PspA/IM30 family protein [Dehalococcoidia bacterium]
MGLLRRISQIFRAEASGALDKLEDPKQALDFGLVQMQENLQKVSRSLLDVSVAKRKLEMQRDRLDENMAKYERQAGEALTLGREDLARVALERKQESAAHRGELEKSIGSVNSQLQSLEHSQASLRASIDGFRVRKEELTAVYDAARAQLQVRETLTGISRETADIGSAIQRAEERILETQARVEALDELVAVGTLEDVFSANKDDIDRELER